VRRALSAALVLGLAVAWFGAVAGGAAAAGAVASWSERQTIPGLTERTIWGRDQVYVYRLPRNVTHTGDLHVELTYTPADRDCFIYLLGPVAKGSPEWQVCPGTYGQGFLSLRPGREEVDYAVPAVLDQDPVDEGLRGDAYYVVVQAANGVSHVRLTGYLPRTVAGSVDTTSEATFTRDFFRAPARANATISVAGAPYGSPFDFTPTSQGQVETRLQYPADPVRKTVAPASTALAACFEQYVYPPLWDPEDGAIPVSQPADPSHWDLFDLNRHAAAPLAGDDWYGLQGDFVVQAAGPWLPRQTFHYVPVLWLAAAQPYAEAPAQPGPPATGRRTVGYKATLLVPQNLRLAAASARVRGGRRAVLKGTLAAPVDATPGASVSWAPPGTLVTVERKAGSAWVPVKSVRTGANGAWRATVRVRKTTLWRAVAQVAPGLAAERSLAKRTVVTR
jgi:hypothetical protein